jgi:hypothetical protein
MPKMRKMLMADNLNTYQYFIGLYNQAEKIAHQKAEQRFNNSGRQHSEEVGSDEIAIELEKLFAHHLLPTDFLDNNVALMYQKVRAWDPPEQYTMNENGLKMALSQQVLMAVLCEGNQEKAFLAWKITRLQSICEAYIAHLNREIPQKVAMPQEEHSESSLKHAFQKHEIVDDLLLILQAGQSDLSNSDKVRQFKDMFDDKKALIATDKTHPAIAFLKRIHMTLLANLITSLGIWKTKEDIPIEQVKKGSDLKPS